MISPRDLIVLVMAAVLTGTSAFLAQPPLGGHLRSALPPSQICMPIGRSAGQGSRARTWTCMAAPAKVATTTKTKTAPVIAKPKVEKKVEVKSRVKVKPKTEDAPMFKVHLLGDEEYERDHVLLALQDIIPEMDNTKAAAVFDEAQRGGRGHCGTFPEEQSELYVEQFIRCEPMIFAAMEEETVGSKGGKKKVS
ncbi:unnamed protein product [Choristocarpus tenellus]